MRLGNLIISLFLQSADGSKEEEHAFFRECNNTSVVTCPANYTEWTCYNLWDFNYTVVSVDNGIPDLNTKLEFEIEREKGCGTGNETCDEIEKFFNEQGKNLGIQFTIESCKTSHCDGDKCNGARSTWTVGSILSLPLFLTMVY